MNERLLSDSKMILRPVEPEDAEFMWEVENDSKQWIQNCLVAPYSKENLLRYAQFYEADPFVAEQLRLIAIDAVSGIRVGIVDLYEISSQHRNAYVGIYILPSCRGRGWGTMALELLETYSYRLLNLRNLCARVVEGNDASLRLFLEAGYIKAGTLYNWLLSGNEEYSLHILQKRLERRSDIKPPVLN